MSEVWEAVRSGGRPVRLVAVLALLVLVSGTAGRAPGTPGLGAPSAADQTAGLSAVDAGGLTDPHWRLESLTLQRLELALLPGTRAHPWSSTQPFAVAASVGATGAGQDRLAVKLLHAAPASVRGLAPAPTALKALTYALHQIGRPYLWGATGPAAFDCSGLTQQAYRHAGLAIPRTAAQQAGVGTPVRLADLLPGDLLFYAHNVHSSTTIHHVTMYAGGGMVVHAPQSGEVVHLSPVWLDEYIGAIRLASAVGRSRDTGVVARPAPSKSSPGPSPTPSRSTTPTPTPSSPTPTPSSPTPTPSSPTPTPSSPTPTPSSPTPTPSPPTPTPSPPTPTPTSPTPTPTSPTTSTATSTPTATSIVPSTPTDPPTPSAVPPSTAAPTSRAAPI